jgi:hypothetical protein
MPPICIAPATAESHLAHAVMNARKVSPELEELIFAFQDIPKEGTAKFYSIYDQHFSEPKNPISRFINYIRNYFN